ncbi:cadmium resistance transporter [Floridanema evergladense]|uniref:Cadmium resistance transporter n=1 Tax=Floridaenema evergladense BLCC-F167 TaxID=3153639 RepID=A0ABV4WEL6_9CYAN
MDGLITAIPSGLTAFSATNIDDIVILSLFFSQVNSNFRRWHIVAGQYLGFTALVMASLPGFFSSLIVPQAWIGMLGIVPIAIGINSLINRDDDSDNEVETKSHNSVLTNLFSPQVYGVAAVTVANGSDNISIYVPLFASSTLASLPVILAVFFSMVGVWCYAAYRLTNLPAIASTLTSYGKNIVPFVLIGLGVLILCKSHTLESSSLTVMTLLAIGGCVLTQAINYWRSPQIEKN